MNCKNICNYSKDRHCCGSRKGKEGKYSRKNSKDCCNLKKEYDSPTSFSQSFENSGGIITDNEYEIKSEEDIIEIE